ncbi:amino acid adenylation domain-containing protein, partial [Methylocella sp.]|uniref:amino acid adenylation domain-containing protein n=1 Tax=Methylocella sp. TaxID=1978226 RepID=UPI0037844937
MEEAEQPKAPAEAASFPCSPAQEPFWFMDALDPGDPALNVALRWEIAGRFTPALVEQAFQAVVDRHEILRTAFVEEDGEPRQRVSPRCVLKLSVVDLGMIAAERREAEALALARREARTPFDVAAAPLLRATLLRLSPERAFILVTLHHLVFDAWSIPILARDFGAAAEGLDAGLPARLPELPLQYGDYGLWRAARRAAGAPEAALRYWRDALEGAPYFALPGVRPRRKGAPRGGDILIRQTPRGLSAALDGVGRARNVTLFTFGCAALAAALARLSGRDDILFATQSAGREEIELENLIGVFVNNLALRFDLSGDPTFDEALARARRVVEGAMLHAEAPFQSVVEALNPERDPNRPALVSINFTLVFHGVILRETRHGGFTLKAHPSTSPGSLYDLNFFMSKWPEGWRVSLEYDVGLYDPATAERLLEGFEQALAFACERPQARLSAFSPPQAVARAEPPARAQKAPPRRPVEALFAAAAARAGDAPALLDGPNVLSYRALDRRSTRCARRLMALGVRRGDRVGLLAHRSFEAIIAILGALKAGAAYVPLDPASPPAQLAFMAQDCGLAFALASRACHDAAPPDLSFAGLEDFLAGAEAESDAPLDPVNAPESPAYVMYTSGSTGRPKGVVIAHRGVVRLVSGQTYAALGPDETILHAAPLAFDSSTFEIWGALLNGGRLALVREPRPTLDELCETIAREKATLAFFTTGLFHLLVDERLAGLAPLKRVLAGGEAMSPSHFERARAGLPGTRVVNIYGPTENTTFSTFHEAARAAPDDGPIPIGRPIAHCETVILGPDLRPVADGGEGELACGGDGLALGYLNRPELTAEKFIADPRDPSGARRLYRTGDLARLDADGEILFLGRADRQMKINGKRVEPGEIEVALRADARVADALVERREDHPARPLVAYLRLVPGVPPSACAPLLAALREKLPAHMIPAAAMALKTFPLTQNGKIDRKALPLPAALSARAGDGGQAEAPAPDIRNDAPETPMLRLAGEIWREVMKQGRVAPDADFFALGGHSMMATRIAARASRRLGVKIPVSALMNAPTLRGFSRALERLAPGEEGRAVEIRRGGAGAPLVVVNDLALYERIARELGGDRPILGVALYDPDRPRRLDARPFEAIAADYVRAIRAARPRGPYVLMGYCVAGVLAYEAARQLRAAGEEVPLVVLADCWAPGYVAGLAPARRLASEIAFRLHVLRRQFSLRRAGEMSLAEILASYRAGRALLRAARALRLVRDIPAGRDDGADQWFLAHLDAARRRYAPGATQADLLLLKSDIIATPFTESELGWTALAQGRLMSARIPGWHGDMFAAEGSRAIARALEPLLAAVDEQRPPAATAPAAS